MSSSGVTNGYGPNICFNSLSISQRAQKKLASKFANREVARHFVSEQTAKAFDSVHAVLCEYYGRKPAEKVVKCIIKLIIKLGLLREMISLEVATNLSQNLRQTLLTMLSFHDVQFSYDAEFLSNNLAKCQSVLEKCVAMCKLSDKSMRRVHLIFFHIADRKFLDWLFHCSPSPPGRSSSAVDKLFSLLSNLDGEL